MKDGKVKEKLEQFKELLDIVKGRKDIKSKLTVLTDPDNLDTMSILSKGEAHLLSVSNFLAASPSFGLMFQPMQRYAQSNREPNVSIKGVGRDQVIKFVQAVEMVKQLEKQVKEGKNE